jgi:AcrR family transcriptional regulator
MASKKRRRDKNDTKKGRSLARWPDSDAAKARAIKALCDTPTISLACAAAGISRQTFYRWCAEDEAFRAAVQDANETAIDQLEVEAVKRAKESSDTLLIFLLKSKRRAEYGDRQQITVMHPAVKDRLARQTELIASQGTWDAEELLTRLGAEVWTD